MMWTTRVAAAAAATSLTLLSVAPAHAATVSRSSATALSGSLAGSPIEISSVTATHDGTRESTTGDATPPISVLGNQELLNVGVLAQEATAGVGGGGRGTSAACAGLAGNGGSVAEVGDSRCLNPGEPVDLTLPNLDLTGVVAIDPESALGAVAEQLNVPLEDGLSQLTKPLAEALAPLGNTGISGSLGAIEARCTAGPDGVSGTANIVDTKLTLNLAGQEIVLAELPANPPPNTNVLVDLDTVADTLLKAVETSVGSTLGESGAPLVEALGTTRKQLVENVLAQVAPQLKPLNDNLAEIVLNKQEATADRIEVTALSVRLLPAAEQFGMDSLLDLQIGNVTCGPSGEVSTPREPQPDQPEKPEPKKPELPDVPTKVTSGMADAPAEDDDGGTALLGLLLLVAAGAGVVGYRRSMRS